MNCIALYIYIIVFVQMPLAFVVAVLGRSFRRTVIGIPEVSILESVFIHRARRGPVQKHK